VIILFGVVLIGVCFVQICFDPNSIQISDAWLFRTIFEFVISIVVFVINIRPFYAIKWNVVNLFADLWIIIVSFYQIEFLTISIDVLYKFEWMNEYCCFLTQKINKLIFLCFSKFYFHFFWCQNKCHFYVSYVSYSKTPMSWVWGFVEEESFGHQKTLVVAKASFENALCHIVI
jgi:hypothetical protein